MFTRADDLGWKQSTAFKRCFSIDVDIEFIGVWDTVSSVGLIPRRLPFTTSNTAVRTFRHALSLDERRAKFKANLWNRPTAAEAKLGTDSSTPPKPRPKKHQSGGNGNGKGKLRGYEARFDTQYCKPRDVPTDIEEVWFSGCHCDIGGGSVPNGTQHSLARIPLRWMIRECFKTATGIMFDSEQMRAIGLDPATIYPIVLPRPPPLPVLNAKIQRMPKAGGDEDYSGHEGHDESTYPGQMELEEELRDALSPIYDQLSLALYWWTLEVLPMKQKYQKGDNSWASTFGWNLARPRFIPKQKKQGVKVHRSVKMRMEAEYEAYPGTKYKPRALFSVEPTWVD
ncbi:hypothetical protein K439DRAFT_200070 [Ramaria rubella]|nr:hypothetical protein K439DRAFT_200070 [Ramaria rubella]